jgi:hypothetical protein
MAGALDLECALFGKADAFKLGLIIGRACGLIFLIPARRAARDFAQHAAKLAAGVEAASEHFRVAFLICCPCRRPG